MLIYAGLGMLLCCLSMLSIAFSVMTPRTCMPLGWTLSTIRLTLLFTFLSL